MVANDQGRAAMFVGHRDGDARAVEAQLGEAAFWRAWNEGRAMDSERARSLALDEPG